MFNPAWTTVLNVTKNNNYCLKLNLRSCYIKLIVGAMGFGQSEVANVECDCH